MKKKISLAIICGTILLTGIAAVSSSLAWFTSTAFVKKDENPFGATVEDAYYAYGLGTAESPFGITRPRHLYNLAWLQYLGFYNKANDHQYYFELGADIDMTGYAALPPIGTELNPFVGRFNGQGYTISNLTVSNDFTDYTIHPSAISSFDNNTKKQPHILGLFGVVGKYDNCNVQTSYSSSVNELIDIGINHINVKSVVPDSLMGLAAGYANGTMSNVAVESGTLDLDKTAIGSTATTSYGGFTSNISDYALVGYTTSHTSVKKITDTMYSLDIQTDQEFTSNLQGDNLGFGGSIDMNSVFKRLTNLKDSSTAVDEGTAANPNPDAVFSTEYQHHQTAADTQASTYYSFHEYDGNDGTGENADYRGFVRWTDDGSSSSKHYLIGGKYEIHNYYVEYDNMTGYLISDGDDNYLTFSGTNNSAPVNYTDDNPHVWEFETTTSGQSGYIRTLYNGTYYYLMNNNGNLRIQNVAENQATDWLITIENTDLKIQVTNNNTLLSVVYNGTAWSLLDTSYTQTIEAFTRVSRNNYYIVNTSSGQTITTAQLDNANSYPTNEAHFQYDDNGYIYFTVSGSNTRYYPCAYANQSTGTTRSLRIYSGTPNNTTYRPLMLVGNVLRTNEAVNRYYWFLVCDNNGAWSLGRVRNTTPPNNTPTITNIQAQTITPYADLYLDNTLSNSINYYRERVDDSQKTERPVFTSEDTTYLPIIANDEGADLGVPKKNNTGYFVAGMTNNVYSSNQDDIPRSIIVSKYDFTDSGVTNAHPRIAKSFSVANKQFTDANVYTIDQDGMGGLNSTRLKRFKKYQDSKAGLTQVLNKTISGNTGQVGGFHFFARDQKFSVNKNYVVNAKNVLINGEKKASYDLPVYSLDFYLKDQGFMNFFAAMYNGGTSGAGSTGNDHMNGFFSLHKVYRDETTEEIEDIREIKSIFKNELEDGSIEYVYLYRSADDSKVEDEEGNVVASNITTFVPTSYASSNDLEFCFDTDWILYRDLDDEAGRVFYFEIPLDTGEYCLGGYDVPQGVRLMDGAYLMYLDIGAGASKINRTALAEHFLETSITSTYPNGVALIPTSTLGDNSFKDTNSVCAVVKATYVGEFTVTRDTNNNVVVNREANYTAVAKPSYIADTIQSVVDPGETSATTDDIDLTKDFFCDSKEEKETYRIQYYDYNVNLKIPTITVITDTLSGTLSGDALGAVSSKTAVSLADFNRKIVQKEGDSAAVELKSQTDIDSSKVLIFKYFGPEVEGNTAAADNGRVWTSYAQVMAQNAELYHVADENFGSMYTVSGVCATLEDEILVLTYSYGDGVSVDMTYDLSLTFDSTNFKYTDFEYYVVIPLVRYITSSTGEKVTFFVAQIDDDTTIYFFDGNTILVDGEYVYEITDGTDPLAENDSITITPIVNPNP